MKNYLLEFTLARPMLAALAIAYVVAGCGKAPTRKVEEFSTPVSDPIVCTFSFRLSSQVVTTAPLLVNTPVRVNIAAQFCPGYEFAISGTNPPRRFTSTIEVEKTYTNAGTFSEAFTVLAYERVGSTVVTGVQVVTQDIVITAPAPAVPPVVPPPPAPTCTIAREAGRPVLNINDPLRILISVGGTVTNLKLNGVDAMAGVPIELNPVVPGSGIYLAQAIVTGAGGAPSCALNVQVPTCSHQAYSAVFQPTTTLTTRTTINGLYNMITIDGVPIPTASFPIAPQNVLTFVNPNIGNASLNTTAIVQNAVGDRATCSAVFQRPVVNITANGTAATYPRPISGPVTIAWVGTDVTGCTLTPNNISGLSGSVNIPNIDISANTTYTVTCQAALGPISASVQVTVTGNWVQAPYTAPNTANVPPCSTVCANAGKVSTLSPDGFSCSSGEALPPSAAGRIINRNGCYPSNCASGGVIRAVSVGSFCYGFIPATATAAEKPQSTDGDRTDITMGCFCR